MTDSDDEPRRDDERHREQGRDSDSRREEGRDADSRRDGGNRRHTRHGNGEHRPRPSAGALARRAVSELADLIGKEPEGVISLEAGDDGWQVGVEVLETRRIPDTADILAEYEVQLDRHGRLTGYRRVRRYARGQLED